MNLDTMTALIAYLKLTDINPRTSASGQSAQYEFQHSEAAIAIDFWSKVDQLIFELDIMDIEASIKADFDVSFRVFSYVVSLTK